jgi:hypothetical protein
MATGVESAHDQEHNTHHAISHQLMCDLVVNDKDSFYTFFVELISGLPGALKAQKALYDNDKTYIRILHIQQTTSIALYSLFSTQKLCHNYKKGSHAKTYTTRSQQVKII